MINTTLIIQFVNDSKTVMGDVQKNLGLEISGAIKRIFEVLDFAAGDNCFKLCVPTSHSSNLRK
jgi:hypothetical protein